MEYVYVVERWNTRGGVPYSGLAGAFSTQQKARDFIDSEQRDGTIKPDDYSISQVWFDREFFS